MFQTVKSPSSRGLGHCPFTAATGVRIPLGTNIHINNPQQNIDIILIICFDYIYADIDLNKDARTKIKFRTMVRVYLLSLFIIMPVIFFIWFLSR